MKLIGVLEGRQLRRLAFTLLCLSKYWDAVNKSESHWVNMPVSEIMSASNINTSVKRRSQLFRRLKDAGLIDFSKQVDNTNVRVTFSQSGKTAVSVYDMRNLGYQYNYAIGEKDYYVCELCGITEKKEDSKGVGGRPRKYCRNCAAKSLTQKNVDAAMRRGANCTENQK